MPPAVAIPLVLAGATMVAQNVANKSAAKNNENQQTSAVNNAQQAWQHAQQALQSFMTQNPAPFNAPNIARPTPYGTDPASHGSGTTPIGVRPPLTTQGPGSAGPPGGLARTLPISPVAPPQGPPSQPHMPPAAIGAIMQRLMQMRHGMAPAAPPY